MASASTGSSSGSGRRRSLDAEINLVPFIDLLSMCICFLLITAVWINVGAVQVKQSHGTEAAEAASDRFEMEARFASATQMEFVFKRNGRVVKKQGVQANTPLELGAAVDASLAGWPETQLSPNQAESLVSAAMIYPKTGVSYGDLVTVMDVLRKHRIVNLGVVPSGGA